MKDADGREIRVGDTLAGIWDGRDCGARFVVESVECHVARGTETAPGGAVFKNGYAATSAMWRVITPAPEPAEPAVLGTDANGEPVRVGDFLAAGEEDPGVIRVKAIECDVHCVLHAGFGVLDGRRDRDTLGESLEKGWTRARARELGYPAQDSGAVSAASDVATSPAEAVPDCARKFVEEMSRCAECKAVAARVNYSDRCVYCFHRSSGLTVLRESGPGIGPAPAVEPFEEHGAWETPGAES